MGRPPDIGDYNCIKSQLNKIIRNEEYNNKNTLKVINNAVKRTNNIVTKTYMLLRLVMLDKYHNNLDLPNINADYINIAFKVFIDNKGKKTLAKENKILLDNLKSYYSNDIFGDLEDGTGLNPILTYSAITMNTSIINNIKLNFISYLNRYVNAVFTIIYKIAIENKEFKKQLYKELKVVKEDLINNTLKSNFKYHLWISSNRKYLVPILTSNESIYSYLQTEPHKFLKHMIFMSDSLEKLGKKQYQFFPLQSSAVPKHIRIDNRGLITLFENNVSDKFKIANIIKHKLWSDIFNIKCKRKGYSFDYSIITDGYSVAMQFISSNGKNKKDKRIENMQSAKNHKEKLLKYKSYEEKELLKKNMNQEKRDKEENKKIINEKIKANKKDTVKKDTVKKECNLEFPYIDDVPKDKLEGKHIFIDPGKRTLFTMLDDNGTLYQYNNCQYIRETKRIIYNRKTNKIKEELQINITESKLSSFNSKTIDINNFKEYIKNKIEANKILTEKYFDKRFRQYKWYSFINKKRAEDNLLNKIESVYSADHKIIIGDWSIGKQMSNFISTPNIRLKRKLKERFEVYNIDEFRTSCIHYKTEKQTKNLFLKIDYKKTKMHSILTFQMENTRLGCINRDKNAVYNIRKLFNCYISGITPPEIYSRSYKLE